MTDFLDGLRTPDDIAARISDATGTPIRGRTVWERAIRLGIAKKMGRTPLIHVDDIPTLLTYEHPRRGILIRNEEATLRQLKRARRRRMKKDD